MVNKIPTPKPKEDYPFFELKRQFAIIKSGHWIGNGKHSIILSVFGCNICPWNNTDLCPHGLKKGEVHANKICSHRIQFLKYTYDLAKNNTKIFQIEELIKLKMMDDKLFKKYLETGKLDKGYHHVSKNLITLTDKMRKQDEGIKLQGEVTHTYEDFRKIVDIQAEQVKNEKDGSK